MIMGLLLLATLALGAVVYTWRPPAGTGPVPEMRFAITTPADSHLYRFALSPDGTKFVYRCFRVFPLLVSRRTVHTFR